MNTEQNGGVKPVRVCSPEEKDYVLGLWKLIQEEITQHKIKEIFWRNFYIEGEHLLFKNQPQKQGKLVQFMEKMIQELFPGQRLEPTSIGFLLSPQGHAQCQNFHYDFNPETRGIFIPLVHLSSFNSTQYISFVPKSQAYDKCHFAKDQIDLLEKEGLDFYEVKQVVCKPFTILKVPHSTVHRGMGNRSDAARPMLYIHAFPKGKKVNLAVREYESEGLFVHEN